MDKGIFYLVCSVLIVGAVVLVGFLTTSKVATLCTGKTMVEKVTVLVTPSPTATPTAGLKFLAKPTVKPVAK